MNKKEIYNTIRHQSKLPAPSRLAHEVVRLCYSNSSSLKDIAHLIDTDPALSAELLKYANSTIMAASLPADSLHRVAVKIGIKGIVNLTLSLSLLTTSKEGQCTGFNYGHFWAKSFAQAVAARKIAVTHRTFDPDEVFTCSLLSHIGELGLATAFPAEYSSLLSQDLMVDELLVAEQNAFGINHEELTFEMISDWGLPKNFCHAVRIHYRPGPLEAEDEVMELSSLLYLARQIANICILDLPLTKTFDYIEQLANNFGVEREKFNAFFDEIVAIWQEWGTLYNIPTQHCPLYYQIKAMEEPALDKEIRDRSHSEILILAVDDDPMMLLNLSRILKGENRTVITAKDGREALEIAEHQRPDMVITDWRMPHLDGLELCLALRSANLTQHTYIIMLTGNETDEELVQAFDAGADDYVVKPFTPKVLEARIKSGERLIRYQQTINADREVIQRYVTKLASANRKLQTMAMTDALTGLPNRRSAMVRMKDVVAESNRYGENLSCIMIDIDHFKNINDTYGHDNGDIVLKEIARIFLKNARSYDMVSRIGGEEFLVISTRSGRSDSLMLGERLRSAVEAHTIELSNGTSANATISVGVATWNEELKNDEELIKAADDALYKAKKEGRNRVKTAW